MKRRTRSTFALAPLIFAGATSVMWLAGCPAKGPADDIDASMPDAAPILSLYTVTPSSGPVTGGTSVELYGQGFEQGAAVRFGSAAAANVEVPDGTRITCQTPPGPGAGPVTVSVELPDSRSTQLVGGFTYVDEPAVEIEWCNLQSPAAATTVVQTATELVFGRVYSQGVTDRVGQGPSITGQLGYGPTGSNPAVSTGWLWTDAVFNVDADQVNDEYMATLTVPQAGQYDYAYRFNGGASWVYCDLDGSDNGYSEDQAGHLTVNESTEPMVDWCGLWWPAQTDTQVGVATETIFGQVYEPGVTEGAGAGAGIAAELGFGPPGTHPGVDPGWVWQPAGYNDAGSQGSNDEYSATLTPQSPGTFDYAFRFSLDSGPWTYCDLNGSGDGYSAAFAGEMTVTGSATGLVDWCNLQWPASVQVPVGGTTELIFGRVYAAGCTPGSGQGAGIQGQVGYGPQGTDPSVDPNWQWTDAAYNMSVDGLVPGDLANDEYMASVTGAPQGTYDYAYRFSRDGGLSWLFCDRDGSDNGYSAAQAGTMEVTSSATPMISSVVLSRGTVLGGSQVTIHGSGFESSVTVTFGGQTASVGSVTAGSIVCTTPPHAAGDVDVTVTNGSGPSDTLPNGFEYVHAATVSADGDLADWDAYLLLAANTAATDATPGYLSELYVAFDADNLYVGIEGTAEATQSIILYLDLDYGQGTGVRQMVNLTDNTPASGLDDAISGTLEVTDTAFGAEFAAGTVGLAQVTNGTDPNAGWRDLQESWNLWWLDGTVAAGSDTVELAVPLLTLWSSGVPAGGAMVGITVKLLKDAYGVDYANQTLPEDSGTSVVSAVAVVAVYPAGEY